MFQLSTRRVEGKRIHCRHLTPGWPGSMHGSVEDIDLAERRPTAVWRDRGRTAIDVVIPSLPGLMRIFRGSHHASLGSKSASARCVGSPDGLASDTTIIVAQAAIGEGGYPSRWALLPAGGIDWHSHKHPCHLCTHIDKCGFCLGAPAPSRSPADSNDAEAYASLPISFLQARPGLRSRDGRNRPQTL